MISANFSRTFCVHHHARFHFSTDIVTVYIIDSAVIRRELSPEISYIHSLGTSLSPISAYLGTCRAPLTFTDRDAYVSRSSRSILFTTGRADLLQPFNLAMTQDRPYYCDRITDDAVAETSLKLMACNSLRDTSVSLFTGDICRLKMQETIPLFENKFL